MKLLYSLGERIGARCRACKFTGIFLEDKLVPVPRKIFGLHVREIVSVGPVEERLFPPASRMN